ncbi:branched-chain amino acid ABC transporter permease [Arsenicitalea aurantiaca]|uniref:Branched-chain amino acid ABC transporter permease n=1 Tax=Arsenicitalea aurantiaca TaxID=1783274 RepID=A0A433X5M0_9HYPH|nr:branched-chain amino acid ABC transporter permease [Arsenicitalea aurantiaca]RUT29386.1 branched-chain amino acid ABC transporter permease [Arsenicitalea aurantiaca]
MKRSLLLFAGLFVLVILVGLATGAPFTSRLLVEAAAYALIALGLNIQWGYGGLFNFGILGFIMVGGFATMFVSYPVNAAFWGSDGPMMLGRALLAFGAGALLVIGARRLDRFGITGKLRTTAIVLAWIFAYILYRSQIDPAAAYIESTAGFVGGLGLHPVLGWAFGGVLAAGVAYIIGKICLGLRTDYLAIATIGIAEIIRALIKNMEWLTRGTLTVTPIPWPTPLPQQLQTMGFDPSSSFVWARLGFFALVLIVLVLVLVLLHRAYGGPWGRMMRAIRDNHIAAGSMGKDVTGRQLEIFVLGSVLMGIGGAMLVSFTQILDPNSYQPINHTFLVWVMLIVGGAGNNLGAVFGAVLIWIVWVMSDSVSQGLFTIVSNWTEAIGWGAIPDITTRSVQMRVFVLGLVITIALRYAPRGLLPEVIRRER